MSTIANSAMLWMQMKDTNRTFTPEELDELKHIHRKHTGELLSDREALEMGTRLLTLFRIIAKPLPY